MNDEPEGSFILEGSSVPMFTAAQPTNQELLNSIQVLAQNQRVILDSVNIVAKNQASLAKILEDIKSVLEDIRGGINSG